MAMRSLFAFWLGGAGSGQQDPAGGFGTPLPIWSGGVSSTPEVGFGSLLAFWMGGGGLRLESPVSPITAVPVVRFRDRDEELLSIMAAIMPQVVQIIKD